MIKINIFHLNSFLQTVNGCTGAINILTLDGKKDNLNKNYQTQEVLRQKYRENKSYLCLSLDIPCPKDYMQIVVYSIGNC